MLTAAPALAAIGFLAAAVCSALGPPLRGPARVLAALSALLLVLPGIEVRPSMALALGAAALATPLPCVLASAGAVLVLVFPEAGGGTGSSFVLGLAGALAAGAVSSTLEARLEEGKETWPAAAALAGAGLVALLVRLDGGAVLRWAFVLGSGPARVELRGAGLVMGLALVLCLGGTLLLAAHRLAPAVEGARELGMRVLLPGAAMGLLAAAHVTVQGFRLGRDSLTAGAPALVALVVLAGTLATALAGSLRAANPAASPSAAAWAEGETTVATALVWLGVALAGWECWRTAGTYVCAGAAAAASTGLVGLAAIVPTALPGTRRTLLLGALVLAVLFPAVLQ
jgi:hypothetical protein